MITNDIVFGNVDSNQFQISELELSARIGHKVSLLDYQKYIEQYNSVARYKFAYTKLPLLIENDICNFGDFLVKSSSLSKVLSNCNEAIFVVVTAGIESDRLIAKANIQNKADAFILDAVGSAMIESCMDYICKNLEEKLSCTKRFSPGYSDFPLEFQHQLLSRLNAESTVGISLSNELLMVPMKSITAVIGVY